MEQPLGDVPSSSANDEDPPLDVDPHEPETSNVPRNAQTRRQVLRGLLGKKESISTPEGDINFLAKVDYGLKLNSLSTMYGF